jgi:hypothetical protein
MVINNTLKEKFVYEIIYIQATEAIISNALLIM